MLKRIYFLIVKKLIGIYNSEKSKDLVKKINAIDDKTVRIAPNTIIIFPEKV